MTASPTPAIRPTSRRWRWTPPGDEVYYHLTDGWTPGRSSRPRFGGIDPSDLDGATSVTVGDLNGDDYPDVIITTEVDKHTTVHIHNGDPDDPGS